MNELSTRLAPILEPLFSKLPLHRAMPELVPESLSPNLSTGEDSIENPLRDAYHAAAHAVEQLGEHPVLQSLVWLYVDDLERSHTISQSVESSIGSYVHGIMHRREGDFSNAKYWFRRAGSLSGDLDALHFVDEVAADAGRNDEHLVEKQRQEWMSLFQRAAEEAS